MDQPGGTVRSPEQTAAAFKEKYPGDYKLEYCRQLWFRRHCGVGRRRYDLRIKRDNIYDWVGIIDICPVCLDSNKTDLNDLLF
jgi:hypothetical protein